MNRRQFLYGLGGGLALAALPRRLRAYQPGVRPRRLVLVMQNNGTQQANFWPVASGGFTSPILDPLLSNPRIAQRSIVVRGVAVPSDANGTDGNEHDMGFARMWTGERLLNLGGHPWGGGPSVDQIVARPTGRPALTLAVHASSIRPYPKPGFEHRRSFCYVAPGVHRLPTLDPFVAYTRLFWDGSHFDAQTQRRLVLRKSALDVAAADLRELGSRLGPSERAKLDAHAQALRTVEDRLSDQLAGRPGPGATCGAKPALPRDFTDTAPALLVDDESAVPDLVRNHLDLIVAALACDVTRVATLQLGYAGGNWKFDWIGIGEDHHLLAHKDRSDAGNDPIVTEKIVRLNRWYAGQVAYLARALDAIPDGSGSLLDQTLIVWANEFGRGDHNQDNVPIVFIGGAGFGMPAGGRLVDLGRQPFQRVGCTTLRALGFPVSGFGDLPDCGPLSGL